MTLPAQLIDMITTLRPRAGLAVALAPDTELDAIGFDSLDRIRIAAALEAAYGVTIPDTALADVRRLGDLADLVERPAPTEPTTLVPLEKIPAPRAAPEQLPDAVIHPTAELGTGACVGPGSRVWRRVLLADGVRVGSQCTLGTDVHLGPGTRIGDRVKIQNAVQAFGTTIDDEVLLCPGVLIIEDSTPRAVTSAGLPQAADDWTPHPVTVCRGATVGAGAILLPGVQVGAHAMVAAGAVVDRDVPPYALVAGNPHRQIGWVCRCGGRLSGTACARCGARYEHRDTPADTRRHRSLRGE
ncbi:phosphopantetheine-binding protein [Amycolatopsis australiensis]|uniref:Transferase hexapeptide (Six repeat-containing protein) n=1 Tax=Amycolatopsis australiensis TaxID=546364 RepID=A0A1K1LR43_9PSEU|nr:phosphopantetheine-binding protein [Amycolatopsis australiensis]SFW13338.1 transferase hexapeptide (six repeat-containing protein) [Amycolatopsis australiensis]